MAYLSFGTGLLVGWCAASLCVGLALAIHWWKRGTPLIELDDWQDAFADSRARGHNTDAYTFQIAWAYAREHYDRAPQAPEPECTKQQHALSH